MNTSPEYNELLNTKGIALGHLCVKDIALERSDAITAIEMLRRASIPILGGDVYLRRHLLLRSTYDQWHTDPRAGESADNYAVRSWIWTEQFIREYPAVLDDGEPVFSFVVMR
jgi:hypothetical protein